MSWSGLYCIELSLVDPWTWKMYLPRFLISFFSFRVTEFGVHLAELTVDPQGALAIRQVGHTQLFM